VIFKSYRCDIKISINVINICFCFLFSEQSGRIRISRTHGLSVNSSQFSLGGESFRLLGGSLHYFRIPRAYWKDRMLKMKACGVNTLTTSVPWNLHEPERGEFQFRGNLDLEMFLIQAADLGLWVVLRPGPYIGSDLDLGGLPSWLLRDKKMKLRTTYPGFTEAVNAFFDKLIPKVVPLQFKKGGPIIAVQVEHAYGSFAVDSDYMPFLKEVRNHQDIYFPILIMEHWTGLFDGWGDLHHTFPAEDMVAVVREVLRQGMSINLYVFHGGTNFGFMSGASANPSYKPLVTSYDYDAPLSEDGDYTPKYHLLRDIFSRYNSEWNYLLSDVPGLRRKEGYEAAIMFQHLFLWDALPFTHEPFKSRLPVNMENLPVNNKNGQAYGYTLYETTITTGGFLKSRDNIRDRALVSAQFNTMVKKSERTLSLLVENCGRAHSGKALDHQRKGIVGDIFFNNTPLRDFTIYSLDMAQSFIDSLYRAPWKFLPEKPSFPGFFQGRLFVDGYPSDTFVKLPGWSKGVVFINGQNLGRYWDLGPQQALYIPGPFLNSGLNLVTVFEEHDADFKLHFEDTPDLGMTVDIQ
uniref:Beta-1,3-glucuronyltransferase 1 (glucuronosyltransferase P) b n=1 Tax=Astyanax mexicanus TaxID=7994 RepID=A0A8B9KZQ2_ASTMX